MSRRIICKPCRDKRGAQHPEDVAMGFHRRIVEIVAKKPADHGIKFYEGNTLDDLKETKTVSLETLQCDDCGEPIGDGAGAFAVTMWRGDDEPDNWEAEYSL